MATIEFWADRTTISLGECSTLHWRVDGVKAVYYFADGQRWQDGGVVGEGARQECPPHTMGYNLRVVKTDDSVETRQILIQVQAGSGAAINFSVDRTSIRAGECVTFHWQVDGVKAVYFYAEGQRWQDHGVVGSGQRQECPQQSTTYNLRVVKQDDSHEIRQIPVQVQAGAQPPSIQEFSVSPPDQIPARGCVQIRWRMAGAVQHVRLTANDRVIWDGAPMSGEVQDCPPGSGKVVYRIEARGPGGTRQAKHRIHVGEEVKPPPQPVDPNLPLIAEFAVTPDRIPAGGCVQLRWRTAGNTSWVNIVRGEHIVWDNAPLEGTKTDCPEAPGTYTYRLVAFNPEDKRVREDRTVQVG